MAWTTGAWLASAAIAGALTYVAVVLTARFLRMRTRELASVVASLELYEQSLARLLDDPATPPSLRDFLLNFDAAVGERDIAYWLTGNIFRDGAQWFKSDDEPSEAILAARDLRSHRPDLYEAYVNVVLHGFSATMLRWLLPSLAFKFILLNPAKDPATPARAVICAVDKSKHHPHSALPAAA